MYDSVVEHPSEESRIAIEHIRGPLLLLAAEHDSLWHAKDASEYMIRRLKKENFPYLAVYEYYPIAGHYLLPSPLPSRNVFRLERKYPEQCEQSNRDSFEKTLEFLQNQW